MILTKNDYNELSSEIFARESGCAEIERDGELLTFLYDVNTDSYVEDDYFHGTGAQVITHAVCRITDVSCVNENGEQVASNFDANKLASMVEESLIS